MLPDVIIGGAPRSGTTFLCEALDRHPRIHVGRPFIPEPKVLIAPVESESDFAVRYRRLFADSEPDKVRIEKTSYYLESEFALANMVRHAPGARVLFILREPLARAYSNYLWTKKNGLETLSFTEAVAREGRRPNPLDAARAYARPFDYLCRGDYAPMLRRYFDAFGEQRIGVFIYEHLIERPEELMREVQRFVGVDPLPFDELDAGVVNSASDSGPPLDDVTRDEMRRRARPWVEALAELTRLDVRSAWGY